MKAGGDPGAERVARTKVAGELVDRKLVERHVGVECGDDPVAVLPDRTRGVDAVAVGVGDSEPGRARAAPPLAEMGRGQQTFDGVVKGAGRSVGKELGDLRG